jgi:hypothetical protein
MMPTGEQFTSAVSEAGQKVDVFYGEDGPGRLYQREHMLAEATPALAPLHVDGGALDFWLLRS